jgi:hypothetical protein
MTFFISLGSGFTINVFGFVLNAYVVIFGLGGYNFLLKCTGGVVLLASFINT